jgi:hypothetical protein
MATEQNRLTFHSGKKSTQTMAVRACSLSGCYCYLYYYLSKYPCSSSSSIYNIIIAVVMEHGFIDKGDERMTWGEECSRHPLASS